MAVLESYGGAEEDVLLGPNISTTLGSNGCAEEDALLRFNVGANGSIE